eukprot:TRINITY_DN6551_c0_g2_i1.p1 TRINITY_DN6551_c0_g2~~TRINITY_DN6551_c0_g2_i1.p1  ORF type:complete len:931 (-),score=280.46 TRINITY_DN6551_c0_g2_i1:83-2875(-)
MSNLSENNDEVNPFTKKGKNSRRVVSNQNNGENNYNNNFNNNINNKTNIEQNNHYPPLNQTMDYQKPPLMFGKPNNNGPPNDDLPPSDDSPIFEEVPMNNINNNFQNNNQQSTNDQNQISPNNIQPVTSTNTNTHYNNSPTKTEPPKEIDPMKMPSPLIRFASGEVYQTLIPATFPPPSVNEFDVLPYGNCSPKVLRMSMYHIPTTSTLLASSKIPLGAIFTPLARPIPKEENVPCVDFGESNPPRCVECLAYINPCVNWIDGGRQWVCPICDKKNNVMEDYYSPTLPNGSRTDQFQRPELCRGTVEYVANKNFINKDRPSTVLHYVFLVEASYKFFKLGGLANVAEAIKKTLQDLPTVSKIKITLITYNSTVQFYDLSYKNTKAGMKVMADLEDPFLPISQNALFANYFDSKDQITGLLEELENIFKNVTDQTEAFFPALKCAGMALKGLGGKIILFAASLPVVGENALKNRLRLAAPQNILGTVGENVLYKPGTTAYTQLSNSFSKEAIGVDIFFFAVNYMDIAELSELSKNTGGQSYFLNEDPSSDLMKEKCYNDLKRNMTRKKGFDGLMKIRTSKGLVIDKIYGNVNELNPTEWELASVDEDKTFVFSFKLTEKKDVRERPVIQIALLYTTEDGQRRIRVHTLGATYEPSLPEVFKNSDLDTCVALICRKGVEKGFEEGLKNGRIYVAELVADILSVYRNNCAKNPNPGQLVLPETLKLLPVYALGLLKSKLLRPGSDVTIDERVYLMQALSTLPIQHLLKFIYPTLYNMTTFFHFLQDNSSYLESFSEKQSFPLDKNTFLPSRLLKSSIDKNHFYLLDNGNCIYLWISSNTDTSVLQNLLGLETLDNVKFNKMSVLPQENHLSQYFFKFLSSLRNNCPVYPILLPVKTGEPLAFEFYQNLVEDKAQDMNYVDFLRHLHKTITKSN